jgi:SAM-dependent methyltransferase
MTVGRGSRARAVAEMAQIAVGDRVLDIGCRPGAAARLAARRGAAVIGMDPSAVMLGFARLDQYRPTCARYRLAGRASRGAACGRRFGRRGAISTFHHWDDPTGGLGEIRRVLTPGGRVVLAERLVQVGDRGHAAHGLTTDQADRLAAEMAAAGFTDIHRDTRRAGRRTLVVVAGHSPE